MNNSQTTILRKKLSSNKNMHIYKKMLSSQSNEDVVKVASLVKEQQINEQQLNS